MNELTPGRRQRFAAGDCCRMPLGAWLIHGFKARPEGCDEVITITMRRGGTVVYQMVLQGRGAEAMPWFDIPIWSREVGIEMLVENGAAWIQVNAEKQE